MKVSIHMPDTPTFHHFNGKSKSQIDLFLERTTEEAIKKITVLEREPENTGPHDPVTAELHVMISNSNTNSNISSEEPKHRVKWDKVDHELYKTLTEAKLKALLATAKDLPHNIIVDRANAILVECAQQACPPPPKLKTKRKRPWCANIKPLVKHSLKLHLELNSLKPEERAKSELQTLVKAAKKVIRKAQRQAAAKQRADIRQAIITSCKEKQKNDFHNIVKKQRRGSSNPATVDFKEYT